MKKSVVLLSGGVDSTTVLAKVVHDYGAENTVALCLSYGQKHLREIEHSQVVADYYSVRWIHQEVEGAFQYSDCTLLRGRNDVSHESYVDQLAEGSIKTYVPFRNGLFISYAAAIALSLDADAIYYGAHADDAAGSAYPDCSPMFSYFMAQAVHEGSGRKCRLFSPLISLTKAQVVAEGLKYGAPYHLTWSCYEGGDKPCGVCGTCRDRAAAFAANGVEDPALALTLKASD